MNHSEVIAFGHRLFQSDGDLVEFSLARAICSLTDQSAGFRVPGAGSQMKGARKQVIAEEHTGFDIPPPVNGRHVTSQIGVVDHIIVNQCRSVNHFYDSGKLACFQPGAGGEATQSGGEQHQHWAKLLPLEFCHVRGHVLHKAAAAGELGGQDFANLPKFDAQQIRELLLQLIAGSFGDSHGIAL